MKFALFLAVIGSVATAAPVPGSAPDKDYIVIEDFADSKLDSLPKDWFWRDQDQDKEKLYQVKENGKCRYLAAQDSGSSVILLKKTSWNVKEYPILTWCWKVDVLPPGADERYTETNDSAAGIYMIFSKNWFGLPRQLKYVWSTTLPVGTVDRRKGIGRPWFIVLENGQSPLGKWVFAKVDIDSDHRRVLDKKPKDMTIGIGVLTDANSTKSYARAGYADFRAWTREALEGNRIRDYCPCLGELVE